MRTVETLSPAQVAELKAALVATWNRTTSEAIARAIAVPYGSDTQPANQPSKPLNLFCN